MKKLLLISSLLIIISCSTRNENKSFNAKDTNNIKIVKETISEDSLDNIYRIRYYLKSASMFVTKCKAFINTLKSN